MGRKYVITLSVKGDPTDIGLAVKEAVEVARQRAEAGNHVGMWTAPITMGSETVGEVTSVDEFVTIERKVWS